MKRYPSNSPAPYGLYFNLWPPDARFVGAAGEPLEGRPGRQYLRFPTIIALLMAPVLGGLFVVAFPFLIFAALVLVVAEPAAKRIRSSFESRAHLVRVRWSPTVAYLNHDEEEEDETEGHDDQIQDSEIIELEDEIARRREEE